tara:strand:- start:53 stop:328 length:276 start_codon:yes stop_codon:yes gene_type:complete
MESFLKIVISLSTFLVLPANVKADFSMIDSDSNPLFQNSSIDSLSNSRKERTGFDNNWGMDINSSMEVDLSEWGGRVPSCEEAPGCPICIK